MPPKVKNEGDSPSKSRFDTSPGNPNGWLPATDWGAKETQRCIELLASLALENRSLFYTDEALKPWSYNSASTINKKLQQILTKICKDHETNMPCPPAVRSPKKRATASADDDEDKKPLPSSKKPRKQAAPSPKKATKAPTSSHVGASSAPEPEEATTLATEDGTTVDEAAARKCVKIEDNPSTPTRKPTLPATAATDTANSVDSSEEDCDEDETPFQANK
jgi:hypothetical protein